MGRLEALRLYQILDTAPEEAFDELTLLLTQICETPIAFITLVEAHRQWFKSKVGIDATQNPLSVGFCPLVIPKREILIIPDTLVDQQYATNPLAVSNPQVRFYAGAPLTTAEGHIIGTICALDYVPRKLSQKQVDALQVLSRQVMTQLELRRVLIDLDERQQVELVLLESIKELEKLNQLKDDFLSTVSHELRTPMSNMKIAIQMLKRFLTDTNQQSQRYIKILQSECNREINLLDDLLDLQRLEAASYPISLVETVSLQEWLPSMMEPFRVRTQERQQTLQLNLSPDLPPLISNRASLERILAELLNNACKYTASGGEIVLSIDYKSVSATTIFTINNSEEISASELPRIFEKFYRVPKADRWQQGGTGLGLALVHKLVERLQGNIQVKSSNGWTSFIVQLPSTAKLLVADSLRINV